MAIQLQTTSRAESTTNVTSLTCSLPSGVGAGDVLVAELSAQSGSTGYTPDGWTFVAGSALSTISVNLYLRVATASEPASYTFSGMPSGGHSVQMARYSGVDTSSPIDVAGVGFNPGVTTATITAPSLDIVTPGARAIYGLGIQSGGATRTYTAPSGVTLVVADDTVSNSARRGFIYEETRAAAGATGTRTFTCSASLPLAGTAFALRPAVDAVPTAPTVDAGADAKVFLGNQFTRTATESANGAAITSRAWTVTAGPASVGATLSTAAALSWSPAVSGTYVLEFSASNSVGSNSDPVTVTVAEPPEPGADLVAFWDFSESAPPFAAKQGLASFPLAQGSGSTVTKVADGPLGNAVEFDGTSDYLVIPAAETGALDVAQFGDQVTVAAWVKRTDANQGYIAGLWNEGNAQRNYGLFLDLDTYGGDNQVCGHISYDGNPTAGYPYSRDYSASARQISSTGDWRFVAMTYDGAQIISYLDGLADSRPTYTDNLGNTYSKNPYPYTLGLNHIDPVCDFTVGGNLVGSTIQNLLAGRIGGLWVYSRALSPAEIVDLERSTLAETQPLVTFDWWFPGTGSAPATPFGWKSARNTAANDTSDDTAASNFIVTGLGTPTQQFLFRSGVGDATNTSTEAVGYYPTVAGLSLSELASVRFRLNNSVTTDVVRFVVRVGSTWYASEQTFASDVAHSSGGDWSTAETRTLTITRDAGAWRSLTFAPGGALALGGMAGAIPDGEITAVGFYSPSAAGVVRIDDLSLAAAPYTAPTAAALILSGIGSTTSIGRPLLAQTVTLAVAQTRSASRVGAPSLAVTASLTVTGAHSSSSSGAPLLTQAVTITIPGARAAAGMGTVQLGQAQPLAASGARADTKVSSPALGQSQALTVTGPTVATRAGSLRLVVAGALAVTSTRSGTGIGRPVLAQRTTVTVPGVRVGASTSRPLVAQGLSVVVARSRAATGAGQVVLAQAQPLAVPGARTSTAAGAPLLTTVGALRINGARADVGTGAPLVGQRTTLTVTGARVETTVETVTLTPAAALAVVLGARVATTTGVPSIEQSTLLAIHPARAPTRTGQVVLPGAFRPDGGPDRTLHVPAETHTLHVSADTRTHRIDPDPRTLTA